MVTVCWENRHMIGAMVTVIKSATIPQTGQEIEDAPSSVGMGNIVKDSGKDCTVNRNPNGGKRKTRRRMPSKERGNMECRGNGLGM